MKKFMTTAVAAGIFFSTSAAVHVSAEEYEVEKEDTLWGIATEHGTTADNLMEINNLDADVIHPGQKIEVDASENTEKYTVEEGDTLSSIANQFDVTVNDIKDWNDLSDSLINIGQELDLKGVTESNQEQGSSEEENATEESNQATDESSEEANEESNEEANEESSEAEVNEEETESASSSSEGETFSVTATAYTSDCEGCSGTTATGIDLNANPDKKVIAVDPNVIPLGTEVHVEGYGDAVAADIGGAINGNKIDVHVPNAAEANQWGVRTVNVTVLD